jgi:hypothetical protein
MIRSESKAVTRKESWGTRMPEIEEFRLRVHGALLVTCLRI